MSNSKVEYHNDYTELYEVIYQKLRKMRAHIIGKRSTHIVSRRLAVNYMTALECAKRLARPPKERMYKPFQRTMKPIIGLVEQDDGTYKREPLFKAHKVHDVYILNKKDSYHARPIDLQQNVCLDLLTKIMRTDSFRWWN